MNIKDPSEIKGMNIVPLAPKNPTLTLFGFRKAANSNDRLMRH